MGAVNKKINNLKIHNGILQEQLASAEQNKDHYIDKCMKLEEEIRILRLQNDKEFRKGN